MKKNTAKNQSYVVISIIIAVLIVTVISVAIAAGISNSKKSEGSPISSSQTVSGGREKVTEDKDIETPSASEGQSTKTTEESRSAAAVTDGGDIETSVAPSAYTVPVNGILQKAHDSELLVYSLTMNDYRVHLGVDIAAAVGDPVFAVADGEVKEIYTDPFMGMCLSVDHGGGVVSVYKNLASELPQEIAVGTQVKMGQTIAGVGQSADLEMSDCDHLHFEMKVNGDAVNPIDFIDPSGDRLTEIDYSE